MLFSSKPVILLLNSTCNNIANTYQDIWKLNNHISDSYQLIYMEDRLGGLPICMCSWRYDICCYIHHFTSLVQEKLKSNQSYSVQIYVNGLDLYIISPTRVKGDRAQFILTDHTSAIDIPICSNTHTHTDAHIKINQWLKVKDEILKSQCSVFKPTWISSVVMNPKFLNKMNILIICMCVYDK